MLFASKMISKIVGLLPTVKAFKYQREEGLYYTLMMSTGLTFGTISALFGLGSRNYRSGAVFASCRDGDRQRRDSDEMFANAWFMPQHLLPKTEKEKAVNEASAVSAD